MRYLIICTFLGTLAMSPESANYPRIESTWYFTPFAAPATYTFEDVRADAVDSPTPAFADS